MHCEDITAQEVLEGRRTRPQFGIPAGPPTSQYRVQNKFGGHFATAS
jgi:hypothetical protein